MRPYHWVDFRKYSKSRVCTYHNMDFRSAISTDGELWRVPRKGGSGILSLPRQRWWRFHRPRRWWCRRPRRRRLHHSRQTWARQPPQARLQRFMYLWACWWQMRGWGGAQPKCPLLDNALLCQLQDSALLWPLLASSLLLLRWSRPALHHSHWSRPAPRCQSAPKSLRCQSAPESLRCQSAPESLRCQSAPETLHFPSALQCQLLASVLQCLLRPTLLDRDAPVLRAEVAVLLAKDAIEPVPPAEMKSGFYSPHFIVPKKDGGLRPILDLLVLNRALHKLPFRMLTQRCIFQCVRPFDWFAAIDLKDAYFHVSILPRHRPFLRFAFEGRAYQYKALPFGLSLSPRVFTKVVEAALVPLREAGIRILNYLDDWLILAQSRALLCEHRDMVLSHLSRLGLQVNREKSKLSPTHLFSRHGVGLGQPHSTSLRGACSVNAEMHGVSPAQEGGSTETFSEAPRAYGILSRYHAARIASYETASVLAPRPSPEMGMAPRHIPGLTHPVLPSHLQPMVGPCLSSGRSSPRASIQACCCFNRRLCHGLGGHVQRARSRGALDRAPAAVAYQLPRVAGSMACSAQLQKAATREAYTGPLGQHCDPCVHQPPGRSTLPLHVATRPPSPPLESEASEVASRRSWPRRAQSCSRRALTSARPSGRMATPPRGTPADLEMLRGRSGRPVCLPGHVSLPVVFLPVRGDPRYGCAGMQLASGLTQICVSPSEPSRTDPVQGQGGRGASPLGGALLAQSDLVPRADAPRDSPSLANSSEEGSTFSEMGHPLAPAPRLVEPPRMVLGRDAEVLSGLPPAGSKHYHFCQGSVYETSLQAEVEPVCQLVFSPPGGPP